MKILRRTRKPQQPHTTQLLAILESNLKRQSQ
jgi:hypothetical protein